jgi:uncharacterized protein YeaO (DUF488 family)
MVALHPIGIYTGCFFKEYPGAVKVSIARTEPKSFDGVDTIKALAPTRQLLQDYTAGRVDALEYTRRYKEEVLSQVKKEDILRVAYSISKWRKGQDVVLCCWEKTGFCHRQIVAEWLGITEAI